MQSLINCGAKLLASSHPGRRAAGNSSAEATCSRVPELEHPEIPQQLLCSAAAVIASGNGRCPEPANEEQCPSLKEIKLHVQSPRRTCSFFLFQSPVETFKVSLALFEVSLEHPSLLELLQPCAPLHFQQAPWFGCHHTPLCPLPQAAGRRGAASQLTPEPLGAAVGTNQDTQTSTECTAT